MGTWESITHTHRHTHTHAHTHTYPLQKHLMQRKYKHANVLTLIITFNLTYFIPVLPSQEACIHPGVKCSICLRGRPVAGIRTPFPSVCCCIWRMYWRRPGIRWQPPAPGQGSCTSGRLRCTPLESPRHRHVFPVGLENKNTERVVIGFQTWNNDY